MDHARSSSAIVRAFTMAKQELELKEEKLRLLSLTEKLHKRREELEKKGGKKKKGKNFNETLNKAEKFKSMEDHKMELDLLYKKLESSRNGLTTVEAKGRLKTYGHNKLSERKKTPWYIQFIHEITTFFALLLWAGTFLAILAYILDQKDPSNLYLGIAIGIVNLLTGIVTFIQNQKSEAIMEGFKNFIPPKAMVMRDGKQIEIDAIDLVPGDIIDVPTGIRIPADIRIVDSRDMRVDNSSLTGESDPLIRTTDCTNKENPLETKNLAFFGTFCKQGSGTGIVILTGDNTVIGQIANLAASASGEKSPLRKELDKFIFMISTISIIMGIAFFCLGFILSYPVITNLIFGIGIIVANVPEGLLGTLTLCLAITAKRLSFKQVLVKNLESVETLGSTTCICSDKTGTLTKNQMTVERVWYDGNLRIARNYQVARKQNVNLEYSVEDRTFKNLMLCASINSEEVFTNSVPDSRLEPFKKLNPQEFEAKRDELQKEFEKELEVTDYIDRMTTGGNASEAALIKFFQPINDIEQTRIRYPAAKMDDGNIAKIPFNSMNKYSLIIVENETMDSYYTLYTKGAPERVWRNCTHVAFEDGASSKNIDWDMKFDEVNNECGKAGERVLAFSKLDLPKSSFPKGFNFNMMNYNFPFENQTFLGLISLIDPPRDNVPFSVIKCKSAGIKVIMVTGDQPVTATSIARKVNIITEAYTANEIAEQEGISFDEAVKKSNAIVIHGDLLTQMTSEEEGLPESEKGKKLAEWLLKPQIVFARTSPAQKLIIVKACQKLGHIVAVTGDGVNDSPAIKKADIGVAMGLAGTDVAKDAADMILLTDDFSAIVLGVEEGRKIFDNLKKTCAYVLTSNIPEILPFISLIIIRIPIPLSTILILCVDLGTDVFPSMAFAYEEAELDIMVRAPRKKHQHLVNAKMMVFSYLQMGWIQSFGGFLTYFIVMRDFGFTFDTLIFIVTDEGYRNKASDVYDPTKFNLGNSNLKVDGTTNVSKDIVDWNFTNDIDTDLRMFYVKYDSNIKKWSSTRSFGACRIRKTSPVSNKDVCYTTEALKYAQTAFFFSVVLCQYNNAIACKTRKLSVITQGLRNKYLIFGYLLEAGICFFLAWVPFIQTGFGTRDPIFIHFGMPALPFSIFEVLWAESRKYLIRNYPAPKGVQGKPNWFERNGLW